MTQPAHVQTSHPRRKLGRRPRHTDEAQHPRLKLAAHLHAGYRGAVPAVVDYARQVTDWGMLLNDQLGDCTAADYGHAVKAWSLLGQGTEANVTARDVEQFYAGSTGYRPGHPDTDQGGNLQDVSAYARRVGMAGHRIAAFFEVDPADLDELRAALWLFGPVSIGMDFPAFAMDQLDAGQPWDRPGRGADTRSEGGHDVLLVAMDGPNALTVVTWGQLQYVTPRFWSRYMAGRDGEAWSRVSLEWAKAGHLPNALDCASANAAFTQLTGQRGPFPGAGPVSR